MNVCASFENVALYLSATLLLTAGCAEQRDNSRLQSDMRSGQTGSVIERVTHPLPPDELQTSSLRPEIRRTKADILDVYLWERNYTRFSRPHHIYQVEPSPTDRYLLVWHMDYPPRKVSIFDVATGELISSFEPGAGGSLAWAADDLLFHHYGAGTSAHVFAVYDTAGRKLWGGFTSGVTLDDSGRYVLVYPSVPPSSEPVIVADVATGRVRAHAMPETVLADRGYTWLDGRSLRFWYTNLNDQLRSIDMRLADQPGLPFDEIHTGY